ncbi:hypothetical protein NPIL_191581, partial [Nephila pilipes]
MQVLLEPPLHPYLSTSTQHAKEIREGGSKRNKKKNNRDKSGERSIKISVGLVGSMGRGVGTVKRSPSRSVSAAKGAALSSCGGFTGRATAGSERKLCTACLTCAENSGFSTS